MLAWWYLLIPDPILFLGAIGTGAFFVRIAVEIREAGGCLFDLVAEIFLGDAGTVRAGFFLTIIGFDGPIASVLVEARTLPAGELVKPPDSRTKDSRKRSNIINFDFCLSVAWLCLPFVDP